MRLPNKLYSYSESTLSSFPILLDHLQECPQEVFSLYKETEHYFYDLSDYLEALSFLYALNKVRLNNEEKLEYVD